MLVDNKVVNKQNGFSALLLIVGLVIIGILGLLFYLLQNQYGYLWITRPLPKITPTPTPVTSLNPSSQGNQLYLYTASNDNLSQIDVFPNLVVDTSHQVDPPVAGPEGIVFINDSNEVDQYNLETKIKTKLLTVDKDYSFDGMNFQVPDSLFITELPKDFYGGLNPAIIIEKNLTSGTERRIASVQRVLYGSLDYLYKTSTGQDLVGTFGGNGCRGYGNIYKILGSRQVLVTKTGGGCNRDPLYIGSFIKKDQLVMMSYSGAWKQGSDETYDSVYLQNSSDSLKTILLDMKTQNKPILSYVYNSDQNKLAFFYKDGLYVLDIESGKQTGPITLNQDVSSFYTWKADYGIGYFKDTKTLWTVFVPTGDVKKYQLPPQFKADVTPQIIGVWKGSPIISILQTP